MITSSLFLESLFSIYYFKDFVLSLFILITFLICGFITIFWDISTESMSLFVRFALSVLKAIDGDFDLGFCFIILGSLFWIFNSGLVNLGDLIKEEAYLDFFLLESEIWSVGGGGLKFNFDPLLPNLMLYFCFSISLGNWSFSSTLLMSPS